MSTILVIDDDPEIRDTFQSLSRRMRFDFLGAGTLSEGLAMLRAHEADVVLLDIRLPDGNGLEALPMVRSGANPPEVIILTGLGDPDGAEMAISGGAWDYLVKPSPIKQTMLSLTRALKYRKEKAPEAATVSLRREAIIGTSPKLMACLDLVAQASRLTGPVLVSGETGTGKELLARTIHQNSSRSGGEFVAVDCASLTETLLESTLFGHRKGSFTGADQDRPGLVKLADGGTLFLDEVGEMPLAIQKAFLRVLQEKRFRPVGSSVEVLSDFRLIAATNRDLEDMAARGEFRQDLLFRLKTFMISLPPLRERKEDLKALVLAHLDALCQRYAIPCKGVGNDLTEMLQAYSWPGNVRELFGVLERALAAAGTAILLSGILSIFIMPNYGVGKAIACFGKTIHQLRWPIVSIGNIVGLAFIMNANGMSTTLGMALAGTGVLFPFFAPILGWLGVFLTGSDTSSNLLFGNLQKTTAQAIGVSPELCVAANTSGGVTGKMISPQSISVAVAATGLHGKDGDIFRFTLWHSIAMVLFICVMTMLMAYPLKFMLPIK